MIEQTETFEQRARRLVEREVLCCMSSLVGTLARGADGANYQEMADLCYQASELAAPVADWEEAALQAGWKQSCKPRAEWRKEISATSLERYKGTAEELCSAYGLEPYDREVFEHWAVSTYLAELLLAVGEKVDLDFAGLCVWARTTTGQVIDADACIEECIREQDQRYQAAISKESIA